MHAKLAVRRGGVRGAGGRVKVCCVQQNIEN